MTVTVGELREKLAGVPDDAPVMLLFEGETRNAASIGVAPNGTLVIVRGKGDPRKAKHFTTTEDGLIGWLTATGFSDEVIADLFDRPADSIKKRKKQLKLI